MSTEWMVRAACRREDPELFFPGEDGHSFHGQSRQAKTVCFGCPVIRECLRYALDRPEESAHGIWAATTARQREKLRQPRASRAGAR